MSKEALRALQHAINDDDAEAARRAIAEGALDEPAATLAQAVRVGRPDMLRLLVEAGAEVDAVDTRDKTALQNAALIQEHQPAAEHAAAMVEALLAAGADPALETTRKPKQTALDLAAQTGTLAALRRIAEHPSVNEPPLGAAMKLAVQSFGGLAKVELLLERGADADNPDALMEACASPTRAAIATLLLERGARPDTQNKAGCTPLHRAAEKGTPEMVEALLERGAPTAVTTTRAVRGAEIRKGDTPRDVALRRARFFHKSAVEAVLRKVGGARGEVAEACAQHPPNVAGVWAAAITFYESLGDAAAERLRDDTFRGEVEQAVQLETVEQAAAVLELLGGVGETAEVVFAPGRWRLAGVDDSTRGWIDDLPAWLDGEDAPYLQIDTDGTFEGKLRRTKLAGRWAREPGRLTLTDDEQGPLETRLESGLVVAEWRSPEDVVLYTFEPPRDARG